MPPPPIIIIMHLQKIQRCRRAGDNYSTQIIVGSSHPLFIVYLFIVYLFTVSVWLITEVCKEATLYARTHAHTLTRARTRARTHARAQVFSVYLTCGQRLSGARDQAVLGLVFLSLHV